MVMRHYFWTRSFGNGRPRRRGVAATEMAILLPFLTFMVVVAVDYCRIFCATQTLRNCAYAGALYASNLVQIPSSQGTVQAATQAALAEGTSLSPPLASDNVTVSSDGQTATVTVQYQFRLLTPYLNSSGLVVLTRQQTMALAPKPGS